jgi:hypothetical protein
VLGGQAKHSRWARGADRRGGSGGERETSAGVIGGSKELNDFIFISDKEQECSTVSLKLVCVVLVF